MIKMKLIIIIFVAIAVGCALLPSSEPTGYDIVTADYGQYPTDYESIVKGHYNRILKDPTSAMYGNITEPRQTWMKEDFENAKFGYLVCVDVNAKNSFGGYTGYQTAAVLIRNGLVVERLDQDHLRFNDRLADMCNLFGRK